MTPTDKPCLEGCYGGTDHDEQRTYVVHATGCPNAPKEPAAPKTLKWACPCSESRRGAPCDCEPAPTPEPPKPSLEALKAAAEAMVKKAFADAREKEARREACARCGMRIEPGMFHSPDVCYSVPTPEPPKPGIRYGGLMCPHGMVRGACAICRNPPPSPPSSPMPEAESVETPWKPEAERMAYEALNAAYIALRKAWQAEKAEANEYAKERVEQVRKLAAAEALALQQQERIEASRAEAREYYDRLSAASVTAGDASREISELRAELAAIKAQAEDATEYVLAVENKQLRAEVERLTMHLKKAEEWEKMSANMEAKLRAELAEAKAEIGKLREVERECEFLSSRLAAETSTSAVLKSALDEAHSHAAFVYRERDAERAAREKAEAERDELALLTVPSDEDAQLAVRLRIAEARVAELEEKLRIETNACRREEIRSDSHLSRVDELESLLASYADDSAAIAHTVVDSQQQVLDEGRAILARSAKGGANV